MDNAKNPASGAQYARLGLTISNGVIDAIDGNFISEEMQQILKNETFIREATKKIVSELLSIQIDLWSDQKTKIERFYKSCFQISVDWSKVLFPEKVGNVNFLEYVLECITEDDVFNSYAKKFGKDKVWKYYENIRNSIKEQQVVPIGDYTFSHRGGLGPDEEHLNKSYNGFYQDGNNYMVPKEGLLAAFRCRFETDKIWDVKGLTSFHTLDTVGNVMYMYRDIYGQFRVDSINRASCNPDSGPRQVWRSNTV